MTLWLTGVVMGVGMLTAAGLVAVAYGLRPAPVRLGDAFAHLDGTLTAPTTAEVPASRLQSWGLGVQRLLPLPIGERQLRLLELKQRTLAEHLADKLALSLVGATAPGVLSGAAVVLLAAPVATPVLAGLIGLVVGWFLPDLLLSRDAEHSRSDAEVALFSFFDLVTLERLANQSATHALTASAEVSDHPVFVAIRGALARARLQQQPPYEELRRLGERLRLPQLVDVADVMQLEETGAALSEALRARVRELRDAHLTGARIEAHEVSERMTVMMSFPAIIFGLIFLIPPLLRLLGSS